MRGKKGANQARIRRPKVTLEGGGASLSKVGWMAGLGFLIGVVWPRLLGVSLVPEAPVREAQPREEESKDAVPSDPGEQKKLTPADLLEISQPQITSCRDAKDKPLKECNDVNFDELFHAPLLSLTTCPGANGVFGTLSLGFVTSFQERKVHKIESGRSTNLPEAVLAQLMKCAEAQLGAVQLGKTRAGAASYTIFYKLLFKSAEVAASEAESTVQASGIATVEWRTALVRDEPDGEGPVRARVLAGARLTVTGRRGDWYRVKYDAKGREGWTHGAALGLVEEK